jgi:acetyl-CoA carboxylase biotin carboxyl carrier protein
LREAPEIGSIEIKGWFGTGVVITRTSAVPSYAPAAPVPALAPTAGASELEAAVAPRAVAAPALKEIKSPMVGTWYKSPEPGADPYVKVGSRVTAGQTVCIIEAMKIMNEIEAEITGVIREVCVEDAQPVEFGQVLFRVDPNG